MRSMALKKNWLLQDAGAGAELSFGTDILKAWC